MVCHTVLDPRRAVRIESAESETKNIRALSFRDSACSLAKPAQYAMIWVPSVDEVPMSLCKIGPRDMCSILVENVGKATRAIHHLTVGQSFGLRGPYGNSYTLVRGRALLVAGGMGIAPILALADALKAYGSHIDAACGAQTTTAFCGLERARTILGKDNLRIATDDGSLGAKGFVTTLLPPLLRGESYEMVYCCGPESMIKEVYRLTEEHGLPLQASMERIIKCSLGICGSCMIGRYRVCKDGLVLGTKQLREIADELGTYRRGTDGRRIPI